MSKNKDIDLREIKIPTKGTLLERFNAYLKTHKKKNEIIDFIGAINAQYIGKVNHGLLDQDVEEILEFCEYFNDNFVCVLAEQLAYQWPDGPFILRLGDQLEYEAYIAERKERISKASPKALREARSLADTIFEIRAYRFMTGIINYEDGYDTLIYEIPKTIPKDQLLDTKEELLYICLQLVEGKGSVVIRLKKGNSYEVFGIDVSEKGLWMPISKEEMQRASCTTADGIELEPEENVTYTEIRRNRI